MANIPKLKVLLTNDDGPPGRDSPYIYGLYRHFTKDLGWDVKVVIPSSQKSWIGKAYQITEVISGRYYYPKEPYGKGETSESPRSLKEGEVAEWVLLDGTPATCANIGLHNLYHGQIDLLISGPNLGRNSSAAFALSSGTIGAALSSSLSKTRSIALSYGTVHRPTPTQYFEPAHVLSAKIIKHLWENWGSDDGGLRSGEVDLYNVNIPMVEGLLDKDSLPIYWTRIWRNSYGRLFKSCAIEKPETSAAGPDALDASQRGTLAESSNEGEPPQTNSSLSFKFAPDMSGLINPTISTVPVGSDGWVIAHGWVSVTPMRACFAEPAELVSDVSTGDADQIKWKVRL